MMPILSKVNTRLGRAGHSPRGPRHDRRRLDPLRPEPI
jgi:hypothetical protein